MERSKAARDLGWSHLAVVFTDDDPVTAAGFSIADNRTAELAEWDGEAPDRLLGNEGLLAAAGFRQVECFWRWMDVAAWVAAKE
jgi:hypothetical protein